MTRKIEADVVLIGAGLTSLTAAFYLKKNGFKVCILEKDSRVGGVIQTHHEQGFIFESGPNTGVIGNPEIAELFEDLHGLCELEIANPKAKKRLIWKKGQWYALPSGLISAITTPLFTFRDKLRILGEPWRKKGGDPSESIARLVKRRLGNSFLDYAVDPFISGIYAGNPEKLITRFALPKLYNLEQNYGSFIRGGLKKKKEAKSQRDKKVTREVFSAKNGLSSLSNALEIVIGKENIICNCKELRIVPEGRRFISTGKIEDENISVDSKFAITTCNAKQLSFTLPFLKESLISKIENLNYAKVVQVLLGFNKWQGIDINAFGGLVPGKEKRNILGILFTTSFFENRAPKEGALLSIFAGGTKKPEIFEFSDEQIIDLVFTEIKEMMQLETVTPDLIKIFRYKDAIAQYEAASEERLKAIAEAESLYKGLFLAGSIRDGIGMADRVKQARDLANTITNFNFS